MPSWDKSDWSRSKKDIVMQGKFEDDPRAEESDKHGRYSQTFGTVPVSNIEWTEEARAKVRKQKPYHLFKKKY